MWKVHGDAEGGFVYLQPPSVVLGILSYWVNSGCGFGMMKVKKSQYDNDEDDSG